MATVLTGDQILLYRLKVIHMALQMQAKGGMRLCRMNPLPVARQLGAKGRTAKQLLASLEEIYPHLKD
jgi:hypothetical protein